MKSFETVKKIFLSKKCCFTYDRRMSYQRIKMFNYGYSHQISEFFKVNLDSAVYRVKNQNVSVYYELNDHNRAFHSIQALLSDEKSVKLIKKISVTIQMYFNEYIQGIQSKSTDYSASSNTQLVVAYENFCKLNEHFSLPTWLLYVYFEDVYTKSLKDLLGAKLSNKKEVDDTLSIISKPSTLTPLDAYNRDLYLVSLSPESERQKDLENFAGKYISWGVYDVNYRLPDIDFHKASLEKLNSSRAEIFIRETDAKYEQQAKEVQKIKEKWKSHPHIFALINLYSLYADVKDWKNYYREQSSYKFRLLFEEIATRIKLTLGQVSFLTEWETVDALSKKITLNRDEIDKRLKNSAFVYLQNELFIVTDWQELEIIDKALAVGDVSSIEGMSAYPGFIKGVAKIIASSADFSKIEKGDILVTSTTRPDYLPFMHMAGGFITNEGGLLSHAAILARELKKPCVIGTKIATKVLKDGDLVEVNADKGIVKILKKA